MFFFFARRRDDIEPLLSTGTARKKIVYDRHVSFRTEPTGENDYKFMQ